MTDNLSAGERLRRDIEHLLAEHELELDPREQAHLDEACLTADLLEQLQAVIEEHGPTSIDQRTGAVLVSGAVVEQRLQRQTLQRLLGGIEIPGGKANALASQHGRRAAQKRWGTHPARSAGAR